MKIIVTTAGSVGDVYPFLAAAVLLKKRTPHHVVVIANQRFRRDAEEKGLEFHAHGTAEDYERSLTPPPGSLRNPLVLVKGISNLMYFNFFKPIGRTFELIREHRVPDTLLLAHGVSFGARLARDAFRIPLISVILSPVGVPSSRYRGFSPFRQFIGSSLCRMNINRFCAAQGLPAIGRLDGWSLSPDGIAAFFPTFFDARSASWPAPVAAAGYHAFETGQGADAVEGIRHFMGGEPTLLFTSGTPIRNAHRLFSEGIEVCRRLGRKGLFVTDYAGQVPSDLPAFVMHVASVPFRQVFPLCEAIVHHGGIGTSMECLLAGKPQLVTPQVADQPYNASRLKELHVADVLPLRAFSAPVAAARMQDLLGSETVKASCRSLRERMLDDDAGGKLLAIVESVVRERAGRPEEGRGYLPPAAT
jgi:rhamnosyltransferase subunit B